MILRRIVILAGLLSAGCARPPSPEAEQWQKRLDCANIAHQWSIEPGNQSMHSPHYNAKENRCYVLTEVETANGRGFIKTVSDGMDRLEIATAISPSPLPEQEFLCHIATDHNSGCKKAEAFINERMERTY